MKTLRWVLSSIFILSPIFCDFPTVYKFQDELTTHCVITNETESSAAVIIANESVVNATVSVEDEDKICDISINITCAEKMFKRIWKSDLSDNYDLLPITDRRWENLPLIHSQYKRKFINIFNITDGEYFNFNFSVKIKSDANILLCDGQIPHDSNCYWIIIGGRDGGKNAFQKCTTEKVPRLESKYPKSLTNYEHTDIPLNPRTWMNFTLNKTNNNYTIKSIDGEEKTILTYTEDADKINTTFVFIGSSFKNPGLWKINGTERIRYTGEPYRIKEKIENKFGWYSFSSMASETHIFLCKGSYGVICYKIEIKRNEKPKVCILDNFESCEYITSEGMIISTNWVHFTLQITNNNYNVISHDNVTLAHFHDTTLTPQHIFISHPQPSSWKRHSYRILVSNDNGQETIDLKLRGKNGDVVCVAVFVYSCTNCNITVILQDRDNNILSHYDQEKKNIWEEVKLKGILTTDSPLKLTTKVETQNGERAFLGDITDCSRNIRILSTHTKADQKPTCHFLKFPEVRQNIIEQSIKVFASVGNRSNVVWLKNNQSRFTELEIRVRYKGCDLPEEPYNIKIKENFVKLEALLVGQLKTKPYATYRFFSQQSKHKPIADYNAPGTEHPTNEEISLLTCKQDGNSIILETASNDCQWIRGPLYCHIQTICSNEYCDDRVNKLKNFTSQDFITQKSQVILTDPYVYGLTNYTITVGVGRNETTAKTMIFKRIFYINTTPLAPPRIDKFIVFSKTNTSISIRWKKPHPPGGILEKFVIEYKKYNEKKYGNISVGTEHCHTWKTYVCATIDKLVPDFQYDIKVKAKNKGVDELCDSILKRVNTTEIKPIAPNHCSLFWDKYLNLTVNCEYPLNETGPIRQLQITINGNNSFFYDIPDNARHHQIQINATDYSASNISIEAKFSNFAGASNGTQNFTLSPPKMPAIHEAILTTRHKIMYLNKLHIENIDGNSSLFVYGFNRNTKLNLMRTCDDFSILNKEMSTYNYSENLTHQNRSEEIQLIENFEMTSNTHFIVFVKNSFAKFDRCALHSQIPISELRTKSGDGFLDDKMSVIGWIVAGLLLIGISSGIVFYMYKKKRMVYQPSWLPSSTSRSKEPTLPLVTQKFISGKELKSHSIKTDDFQRYVIENEEQIKKQYTMIDNLNVKSYTAGMLTNNIKKNRYKNIVAYDETRVVLDPLYLNEPDDYINANHIMGFNGKNSYIATQAPTAETLDDFWLMIWQQNVECIVMLTKIYENGKKKCEQYYPTEEGKTSEFQGFKLYNQSIITNDDVIITQLSVSYEDSSRQITHIVYTGWPNENVPPSPQGIIEVLHAMKPFQLNTKPIVVHCSGGVGRTGTLILCDIASKMAAETGTINMLSITRDLRQQRMQMVRTLQQYVFAHEVVMHITSYGYEYLP